MAQMDMTEVTCGLTNTLRSVPAKFHNDCRYQAIALRTPRPGSVSAIEMFRQFENGVIVRCVLPEATAKVHRVARH